MDRKQDMRHDISFPPYGQDGQLSTKGAYFHSKELFLKALTQPGPFLFRCGHVNSPHQRNVSKSDSLPG